jgi:hypothetical protein
LLQKIILKPESECLEQFTKPQRHQALKLLYVDDFSRAETTEGVQKHILQQHDPLHASNSAQN